MLTVRSTVIAVLSFLLLAEPALAQRRAPPSKGGGKRGHDHVDRGRGHGHGHGKGKRRAPPSEDRGWKVRKPARVKGFSPASGPPGSQVVITGKHFGPNTRVRFNGRPLRVLSFSHRELRVAIPRSAVTDHFVISKPGFSDVTSAAQFEVVRPPMIRRFRPPRGEVGITITIKGQNFLSSDQVVINDRPLATREVTPRRITATIPNGAVSGKIGIRRGGRVVAWSRRPFVVALPPPAISGFSPRRGPAGTLVRIDGSNFDPTDVVELNGRRLPTRRRGQNSIEVVVGGASGPFVIRGRGGRRATSARPFVLIRPPKVRRFAPHYGPPGTQITIQGAGFLRGDRAFIGQAQLTIRTVSDSQIVAELPAGVSTGRVSVRRGGRPFFARGRFRVVHSPTIASFNPKAGPLGAVVTVRGEHFTRDVSVLLSGRKLPIVRRRLPNEVDVRILPGARTGRLVAVTNGGSGQSPSIFTVRQFAVLDAFFPVKGLPGTKVTLRGRHFHPGMKVFLSGRPLPVSQIRPRSAQVVIAAGIPSGRLTVETYGRRVTGRLPFRVEQPRPELSFTFTPQVARRGGDVTIHVTPPRHGVTVYLNGRPLPKRVIQGGRMLIVTVPGDAQRRGTLELEYRGRRYQTRKVLRIR